MRISLPNIRQSPSRSTRNNASGHFESVPADETAFALSIFVSAANGQIQRSSLAFEAAAEDIFLQEGREHLDAWSVSSVSFLSKCTPVPRHETTLDSAFMALWTHYRSDNRRTSICARVVGFYFLTQKICGLSTNLWTEAAETSETVVLNPAAVEALARIPMSCDGLLQETLFLSMLAPQ